MRHTGEFSSQWKTLKGNPHEFHHVNAYQGTYCNIRIQRFKSQNLNRKQWKLAMSKMDITHAPI